MKYCNYSDNYNYNYDYSNLYGDQGNANPNIFNTGIRSNLYPQYRRFGLRWNNNYFGNPTQRRRTQIPYQYYTILSMLIPSYNG